MRNLKLSKIRVGENNSGVEYADEKKLMESLHALKVKENLPIFDLLEVLKKSKIDTVSLSRDKPFYYLYARRNHRTISVILRESNKETEFEVPIDEVR